MKVRVHALIGAWLCATLFACGAALAQVPEAKYRLSVEAPTKELREMIEKGLQLARWQDDPQMTLELLRRLADEAVMEARGALAAEGYFSALVSYTINSEATPWSVVIRVEPGTRATVRDVKIAFTGPATEDREAEKHLGQVRSEWLLRPGMPFTREAWNEAKREAVRKLSSWRYASARIASSRARVDAQANTAILEVTLESGLPFVFGDVQVRGTERYPEVISANLSPLKPGTTYEREELELYTRRLLETGYFAGARVDLGPEAAADGHAPVQVSVIEGHSQNIEGGVSFTTDRGVRLEAAHRNVDMFDSAWRGRSALRWDELTQEARYDLDAPPLSGARWWSGFTAVKNEVIQNEENLEFSAGIAHNWAGKGSPTTLLASFHLEEQQISGQLVDNQHAVFFGLRVGFRETDAVVLPRRGYFGQVTGGVAPENLSTEHFLRGTARLTVLVPLGRNDDLTMRAEGGLVVASTREGIPSTFLFRTGGDQTVRGYDFESLGVRQGDAVLGGRYLAFGSVEYTHWFSPVWGLAAFVDGGNAWDTGKFEPAFGIGGGVRFRTPIGPVRADVAYGDMVDSWRLHFSVGFVF
ncbi:MAG TPA: BamA/TamA family outer membrane protein [Burkholderiales bacterium]|nr:BamA/TamA family outer membrane protein [Burkholderiales bacterium]